jgi:hypothetical protein
MTSFPSEFAQYVGRVRQFERADWVVYVAWVGLMLGLVFSTGGFLLVGNAHGAPFPAVAWWVPIGAVIFTVSIAIDTIGHRTVYKAEISGAEGLVHGITILCGISSCVLLCVAYQRHDVWIPALVLTLLSLLYSLIDEAFHWRRYVRKYSDRVEMWSHVGILAGHSIMMTAWWVWFFQGYGGVPEAVAAIGALT